MMDSSAPMNGGRDIELFSIVFQLVIYSDNTDR